ncbi:MAG: helix-turn-helix domain-containing protein [Chloroflexi bacterium]|nr:helix-turn-helix domain-containing protein [Chloroflexota bacterium]
MDLLTVQETARMLKVAPITIRRYIAGGRLPAVKVGRGLRVEREAVEQLIQPVAVRPINGRVAKRPTGRRKTGILSADDPIWDIVGTGRSEGPTDVSENKRKYLADAYFAKLDRQRDEG